MKQELIDEIKKGYEISTNKIKERRTNFLSQESINTYDKALDKEINKVLNNNKINNTNGILMYISELKYEIYKVLFGDEIDILEYDNDTIYALYIDIESNEKYFVKKEEQKEFEEEHKIIVPYKNPNCNAGWNHYRNMQGLEVIRREFIKETFYNKQEKAAKHLIKKYQVK